MLKLQIPLLHFKNAQFVRLSIFLSETATLLGKMQNTNNYKLQSKYWYYSNNLKLTNGMYTYEYTNWLNSNCVFLQCWWLFCICWMSDIQTRLYVCERWLICFLWSIVFYIVHLSCQHRLKNHEHFIGSINGT